MSGSPQMWTYNQTSGWLDKDGVLVSKTSYSGFGLGLNNPALENVTNVGPIPAGEWTIEVPPFTDPEHGPYCLRLRPKPLTVTYGRSEFLWHGDETEHPGEHLASHGCIVSDRATRTRVYQSGDTDLDVISTLTQETI